MGQRQDPFLPPQADINLQYGTLEALEPADRGSRLAAVLLDGLIFLPFGIVMGVGFFMSEKSEPGVGAMVGVGIAGLGMLALAIYQIMLLSRQGQTLGKRWMKIRIVTMTGANPGFGGAVLLRAVVPGLAQAIPIVGSLFALVDILFIFREDRRCIHDLIATTRVVKAEG